jgi:hypothetical protein
LKRASPGLVCSGAVAALAALWLSACAVPLAPGYAVEKESLEVRYVSGSPPHLAVRATYKLRNVGNAPLSSINLTLPDEKRTGRGNLKVAVDGRQVASASVTGTDSREAPADSVGIPLGRPWPVKQRRNLVISYDLAGSKISGTPAFVGEQGFHFNAAGWLPEMQAPKQLLSHAVQRPAGTQVHLFVPAGFLALSSGQAVGAKKQGGELEYRFRLVGHDLDPFIVAGHYHEQRVQSAGEDIRFWTFNDLSRNAIQRAAERVAATLAFYEASFGPRGGKRSPLWIAQAPEPTQAGLDARSVVRTLPGVVLVPWPDFPQGLAEGDHLLPLDWLVADIWFQDLARPGPPAQLLAEALSSYAVTSAAEAREGIAARQKAVAETLRSYDSLRAQAVEKPILSLSPEDHLQREIAGRKLDLFLLALEDAYGRENIDRGIKYMVQSLRGAQYGYNDFRAALESTTGKDLAGFFRTWLDEKGIPADFRARYDASPDKR